MRNNDVLMPISQCANAMTNYEWNTHAHIDTHPHTRFDINYFLFCVIDFTHRHIGLLALTVFLFSCNQQNQKQAPAQPPDGKLIYRQNCVACHGADGTMSANGAKDLTMSALTEEELIEVISNGRKVMTPFKEILAKEEINAVAKYIMTLRQDVPS